MPSSTLAFFFWAIIGINIALVARQLNLAFSHDTLRADEPGNEYTYVGPDYPESLPIPISKTSMTFQPSLHYRMDTYLSLLEKENQTSPFILPSSKPPIPDEWLSSYSSDNTFLGGYFIRLGPEYRAFEVALFHQLHCLSTLHKAFLYPHLPVFGPEHVGHCLNYLRQHFLCEADDTLEPGNFMEDVAGEDSLGSGSGMEGEEQIFERECMDWGAIFDFAADNLKEFRAYRDFERNSAKNTG